MDTEQIDVIVKSLNLRKNNILFLGTICNDEYITMPTINENFFFIVNTNKKIEFEKMGHWLLFFFRNKTLLFFDSFAINPQSTF